MRAVIQRVDQACVRINSQLYSAIDQGLLIFLGVEKDRIRHTLCDGKRYRTVRQVWIEAITNF